MKVHPVLPHPLLQAGTDVVVVLQGEQNQDVEGPVLKGSML